MANISNINGFFTINSDGNSTFAGSIAVGTGNSSIAGDLYFGANADIFKSSGNLTLDVAGNIILDADGGFVAIKDGGTEIGNFGNSSSDFAITASVQDKDILFKGNDNGSVITALQLDMSNGGSATFRDDIDFGGKITQTGTGANTFAGDVGIKKAGAGTLLYLQNTASVITGTRAEIAFYNSDTSTVANIRAAVDTSATADNVGTDLAFFTRAIGGSLTQKMVIKGGGNVGIGTEDPKVKFHVMTTGSTTAQAGISNSGTGDAIMYMDAANGDFSGNDYMSVGQANDLSGSITMSSSAGSFHIVTGNSNRLTVLQGGNVGIGKALPDAKLEVSGTTKLGGACHFSSDGSFVTSYNYTFRDGVYINNPNSSSAVGTANSVMSIGGNSGNSVITSLVTTGAIGVGNSNPAYRLDVSGNIRSSTVTVYDGMGGTETGIGASGAGGSLRLYSGGVNRVTVENTGRTMSVYASDTIGSNYIQFYNSAGTAQGYIGMGAGATNDFIINCESSSVPMRFFNGGSERMRIFSGGNVTISTANCNIGIGTTSLGSISGGCSTMTLGSTATALSGGVVFQANGTNKNSTYWESDNMRYQNIGDFSHTFYKNNSTVLFTIATTGTVTAVGDVVAYSDKKLKKNIKTLDGSKVYKMRGVSFDRIDTGKKSSGVIAQEMQEVAPELVNESGDTLGVAYGNISGYLIEAIKELEARIKILENK